MTESRQYKQIHDYDGFFPSYLRDYIVDGKIDKKRNIQTDVIHMLNIMNQLFELEGLPDTITKRDALWLIQTKGYGGVVEVKDDLYCINGNVGGLPNANERPTKMLFANVALNFYEERTIDKDCVVIWNDPSGQGLIPILSKYAALKTEAEVSLLMSTINSRIVALISGSTDQTKESAEAYIQHIIDGDLSVVADNAILEALKVQPYGTTGHNAITDNIELVQYLKASQYNILGLNANYNMKREAINSQEAQLGENALLPFIDAMTEQQEIGWDKVNRMFGTNVKVKLNSGWAVQHDQTCTETDEELNIDEEESEVEDETEKKDAE